MKQKHNVVLISVLFFVATFILLYVAVKILLGNALVVENFIAYGVLSLILAAVAAAFAMSKRRIGLIIFSIGYVLGFAYLIYAFSSNLSGWEDIAGLLGLFLFLGGGTVIAAIAELITYFINKNKNTTYDK